MRFTACSRSSAPSAPPTPPSSHRRLRGVVTPLALFIAYLLFARADLAAMYPVLVAVLLACFMASCARMLLRELLVPIDLTAESLRTLLDTRRCPTPGEIPDRAGRFMEGTQYTLPHSTRPINRLERSRTRRPHGRVQPPRRRQAPRREVAQPSATCSRSSSLLSTQHFKSINDSHGPARRCLHLAVAALLQLNTRRGDWGRAGAATSSWLGCTAPRLKMVMDASSRRSNRRRARSPRRGKP